MELKVTEEITEVLEAIWTLQEQDDSSVANVIRNAKVEGAERILETLQKEGLLNVGEDGKVRLLPKGRQTAEMIIRRHRLAERLICDVLGSEVEDSEAAACEFEHLLAEGITNSVCTLLGHPRYCPHNRPIPEGECCRQARDQLRPIVVSCTQMRVGESARVAYFCTKEHSRMLKLSAMGISPGTPLKIIQKWPSYVVQCEETEIALEPDVAKNIYVWYAPK